MAVMSSSEPFIRFSQRTCPIHYFRSKTHVWGGFAQFRCRTSPIPKTGVGVHTSTSFRPEPFLRFSQRTIPVNNFRSKTHVWGGFAQFRCRTSPIPKTVVGVLTKHEFLPPEPILRFSQQTCPIHYFWSKTHVWGWFRAISLPHVTHSENGCRGAKKHEFLPPEPFRRFLQQTCPIQYFRSKTHVWVVSRNFVAARHPFRKWVSGCIQARVFATGTISSFCATNMPNPLL
jgi:hypothetical protein